MLLNNNLRMLFSIGVALLLITGVVYSQSETSPPSNLKSRVEGSTVKLSWEAPSGTTGISYNIYRAESSGMSSAIDPTKLNFSAISNSTSTSYEDKIGSAQTGTEYIYYVVAVGSDGKESAGSNYVNVKMDQSKADQHQDKY